MVQGFNGTWLLLRGLMMKRQIWRMAMAAVVMMGASAPGQEGADLNKVVAPYVNEQTLEVGHADLTKVDTAEIEKYVVGLMDNAMVPADDAMRKEMAVTRAAADVWLARFKGLGGRHVFALIAHQDIWPGMDPRA